MPFTCKNCGGSICPHPNPGIWAKCPWCQYYDGSYEIIMEEKKPVENIDDTLKERGKRYGEFFEHAAISQGIKKSMTMWPGWENLHSFHKEALEMIAHKIARILNGDPNYHDSWHDIVGYAKLAADEILKRQSVTPGSTPSYQIFDVVSGLQRK